MRNLIFIFLLSLSIPVTPAFAHGDHEDAEELIRLQAELTELFKAYLLSKDDSPTVGASTEDIFVEVNGHRIPVNKSAMHQLLTIATMNYSVRHLHQNPDLLQRILSFIGQFLLAIPTKAYNFARHPIDTIKKVYLASEAYAHRLSQSYSAAIFVVIAVTQGAWESLESVVMPAGIHVACTAFNALLLLAVLPLERIGEFSSFAGLGLSFRERAGLTIRTAIHNIRMMVGPRRTQTLQIGDANLALRSGTLKISDPSVLEETLMKWGFFAEVTQGRMQADLQPEPIAPRTFDDDIDFILNPNNHDLERVYVAFAMGRGLSMMHEMITNSIAHARHEGWIERNEWLPWERTSGRLQKINSLYNTSLLMLAAGKASPNAANIKATLKEVVRQMNALQREIAQILGEFQTLDDREHELAEANVPNEEKLVQLARDLEELQIKANKTILKVAEDSKQLKQDLLKMRTSGSYIAWLKQLGWKAVKPAIGWTQNTLGSVLTPLCHIAFGGRPRAATQ